MEQKASGKQWLTDALPELAYLSDGLNNLNEEAHTHGHGIRLTGEVEMLRMMLALLERKLDYFQRKYDWKVEDAEQVWPAALVASMDVADAFEHFKGSDRKRY